MADLTASAERHLYETDRPAWLAYVAPRKAEQLRNTRDEALGGAWSDLPRDYQRAVWLLLDAETQGRIRAVRNVEKDAA